MATSNIGKTREQCKAILDTVSGLNNTRVKLGLVDLADTEEFFNDIASSGPFVIVRPADIGDRNLQTGLFEFKVQILLYYGFTADTNFDYTAAEDLLSAACTKLATVALWTNGAALPFQSFTVERDDEKNLKPRVVLYTVTLGFLGCDS